MKLVSSAWFRLLVVVLVAAGCTPRNGERTMEQPSTATAPVPLDIDPAELSRVQGISTGRDDAPVVIYEFADFQCPACAQFASFATPHIKEQHVAAGRVRYVHYDFPLIHIHPHAFVTARAARCAHEQGRFWEYHDLLYAEQRSWAGEEDVLPLLIGYAGQVGVERSPFESCLRSDRYAEEVTKNLRLGESLGVPGTPTLFVNGRRVELRTLQDLDRIILQESGQGGS